MKKFVPLATSIAMLYSFTTKDPQQTKNFQTNNDTVKIFHVTDSIASYELKKYDEQSGRQTGVPRAIEHYVRSYSVSKTNDLVFVYYSFSEQKFYGNNQRGEERAISTGFPDFISISYDRKTKKTRIIPEG